MGQSTPNWRTFCQFLGILAYKSVWLYCYWTKYASSRVTGVLWLVSSCDSCVSSKTEMSGAASAVATVFLLLATVALAVVLVAAAAIAAVPLCCCCTVLCSRHHRHCRPCHRHCHDIQSPSPCFHCLATYPLLLSLQLSLPCQPRSCRCCCRRVAPALALAAITTAAVAVTQPLSLPPLSP